MVPSPTPAQTVLFSQGGTPPWVSVFSTFPTLLDPQRTGVVRLSEQEPGSLAQPVKAHAVSADGPRVCRLRWQPLHGDCSSSFPVTGSRWHSTGSGESTPSLYPTFWALYRGAAVHSSFNILHQELPPPTPVTVQAPSLPPQPGHGVWLLQGFPSQLLAFPRSLQAKLLL